VIYTLHSVFCGCWTCWICFM